MQLENPLQIIGAILVVAIVLFGISYVAGPPSPVGGDSVAPPVISSEGYKVAPELQGISGYINATDDFTLASLKGKVVLVDFWTYSCINCIRTQPYLNAWHDKYANDGLVIVGVHTPEFDFEKKLENVQNAVLNEGIQYPVVLDNDYQTWKAYQNRYWPRKYLIDAQGNIRYDHIGEGGYEETEQWIQKLLKEKDDTLSLDNSTVSPETAPDFSQIGTPEIYLGYSFARQNLGNSEGFQPEENVTYTLPSLLNGDTPYLEGTWYNGPDYVELVSDTGAFAINYHAKQINVVASASPDDSGKMGTVSLDVVNDEVSVPIPVSDEKLYTLAENDAYGAHSLKATVTGKGFRLYTYTFG